MSNFASQPVRSLRAFTLVELMVVIAIISILAVIAIPAYNNYSLRSKFSEVVLATAPTKTAISVCAVSGDCASSGSIILGNAPPPTVQAASSANASNSNAAAIYAFVYAMEIMDGADAGGADYAGGVWAATPNTFIRDAGGGKGCLGNPASTSCIGDPTPMTQVAQYMNPAVNRYDVGTVTVMLPCVGSANGCSPATKYAQSVSYDVYGTITATAVASSGLNNETFTLTPSFSGGRVDWAASGTCKTRAGGALC